MISRRSFLAGVSLAALFRSNAVAWVRGKAGPPSGWQAFPLGDGGYVIGDDIAAAGAAAGVYCKTDVAGGYYWNGSTWRQLCNVASMGVTRAPVANGIWDVRGAPSNFAKAYMVYGDIDNTATNGNYAVYVTENAGLSWTKTGLTFSATSNYWTQDGGDLPNGRLRLTNQKIVVDPANPNVAYVGMPLGITMTGTYSASTASVMRTLDGGATWAAVSGLPVPQCYPGWAGMCIDKTSGTTTLSGQTVTNRIILPCNGVGVFESTDGGNSFSQISSDPTPSTDVTYTTTQSDSIIIVQVQCYGTGIVTGVSNDAGDPSGSLTWTLRAGPNRNDNMALFLFEYYAVAPTAGTYHITVDYADGCLAYQTASTNDASCTAGTISGTTFTEGGSVTGAFAIGQELTGTGLPSSSASSGLSPGLGNGIFIVSGASPTWTINSTFTISTPTTINGRKRVANQVNVFAVSGCDVSSMPSSAFDSGGPKVSASPFSPTVSITTAASNCLVFAFGYSKNSPGTTTPETGYNLLSAVGNPAFWSEISSAPVAAGTRTPGSTINPSELIADALKQGSGMTIALDGTPVLATSGPASAFEPAGVTTAQMNNAGTYWCINGPTVKSPGGIFRLKSGVWDRMTGQPGAVSSAALAFGIPGPNSLGNAICVDPRPGKEGYVMFQGPWAQYRGFQTQNGESAAASVTWNGVTGGVLTTTITSDEIPWFNEGAYTGQGKAVGDTVIDPATGEYWQASGHGMLKLASDLNFASGGAFVCNADNISQGIEEILVQDVLAIPGTSHLLVGCEDEIILYKSAANEFPEEQVGPAIVDSNAWGIDYASDNPAFVWSFITGLVTAKASCWSYNYGLPGTWQYPATLPGSSNLGGCLACASAGADGLSPTNATASVVIIPASGTTTPQYTLDNGATWTNCSGAPTQTYISTKERPTKLLAADRVNIGTYYLYAPGAGVYRSTDYGANWTRISTFVIPGGGGAGAGYALWPVPGHAGHLWLVGNNASLGTQNLNYSTDGGATWNQVAGVTNADNPGGTSKPIYLALGKAALGNAYPTLLTYAKIGGVDGFYRGVCNGTGPADGFTWTFFGDRSTVPSSQVLGFGSAAGFSQIWGDWNVYGRLYVCWSQNGAFMYNP